MESPVIKKFSVSLRENEVKELDAYAAEHGWNRSGAVRWLIRKELSKRRPRTSKGTPEAAA